MVTDRIIHGDTLTVLKDMPSESIDCVITSPPYWGLRDYGIEGQLGQEPTFDEYIQHMLIIFNEVFRVLKATGNVWVVIGTTFRDKNDTMIPERFSLGMVNHGWIKRRTVIWYKPNCMPSSVKDDFTNDFEYVYRFVKSKKYYFEQQFEEYSHWTIERAKYPWSRKDNPKLKALRESGQVNNEFSDICASVARNPGRNKRTVWRINLQPFKDAHFAVFPEKLVEPMIKAGCPSGGLVLDPFVGSGTTALVARKLGRHYIGIDLNEDYVTMANKRLSEVL